MLERIKIIASLVKPCDTVVDVGSDHANLAIFLLESKQAKKVINIDINNLPLKQGIKNLTSKGLLEKTKNICNDGLKGLKIEPINYLCCSGLGANTIIDIFKNNYNHFDYAIVVPNNNAHEIRRYISQNQYEIKYEKIIFENNHFYELIVFTKTKSKKELSEKEIIIGPYLLKNIDNNLISYWKERLTIMTKNSHTTTKYQSTIKIIKELINHYENQ